MKKKIITAVSVLLPIIILGGVSFAFFTYYKEGESNNVILGGNITLDIIEGEEDITLTNIFPETPEQARKRNDNTMTFTVTGENESSEQVIYDIMINHGTEKSGARFNDWDLMFDLVEIINNEEIYLVKEQSYNEINKTAIFEEIVNGNDDVSHTYKLRIWLSENVIISETEVGNSVYTPNDYKTRYATVKVALSGIQADKEYVKVNFDAAGGEVVPPYKYVVIGEEYGELPTPTKTGYRFVGWNGKNKFNVSLYPLTSNRYIQTNTGNLVDWGSDWYATLDYIPIKNSNWYTLSGVIASQIDTAGLAFYNTEKQYISGLHYGTSISFLAPNDVAYMRLTSQRYALSYIQLEVGETVTPYEPYYVTGNTEVTEWNREMILTAKYDKISEIKLSKETYIEEDLTTWEASGVTINNGVATLNNTSSTLESGYIPVYGEFWYITFDAYTENPRTGNDYGSFYTNTYFYDGNFSLTKLGSNTACPGAYHCGAAASLTLNEWNIGVMYSKTIEAVKNRNYYGEKIKYVKIKFQYDSNYSSIPYSLKNAKIHGQMPNSFYLINIDVDEENDVSLLKYAKGEHDVAYFKMNGQQVSGTQIRVTENGVYTVYAKYEDGYEGVYTIEITNIV